MWKVYNYIKRKLKKESRIKNIFVFYESINFIWDFRRPVGGHIFKRGSSVLRKCFVCRWRPYPAGIKIVSVSLFIYIVNIFQTFFLSKGIEIF